MRAVGRLAGLGLLLVALAACASTSSPSRPGSLNSFDSRAYDTLLVAQAAIEQVKGQADTRDEVLAVNAVVATYNLTYDAYVSWREVAKATGVPPDAATLSAQIATLVTDVAELVKTITGKEGP